MDGIHVKMCNFTCVPSGDALDDPMALHFSIVVRLAHVNSQLTLHAWMNEAVGTVLILVVNSQDP